MDNDDNVWTKADKEWTTDDSDWTKADNEWKLDDGDKNENW